MTSTGKGDTCCDFGRTWANGTGAAQGQQWLGRWPRQGGNGGGFWVGGGGMEGDQRRRRRVSGSRRPPAHPDGDGVGRRNLCNALGGRRQSGGRREARAKPGP